MSYYVGLPVYRDPTLETFQSLLAFKEKGDVIHAMRGAATALARQRLAEAFLESEMPYFLSVDGDMVFARCHADLLRQALEDCPGIGAISALYMKWDGSGLPVCNWRTEDGWLSDRDLVGKASVLSGVNRVDHFGGGFLLVSRDAFLALDKPFYEQRWNGKGYEDQDMVLNTKLQEAGFEPAVHFDVCVQHVGPTTWDSSMLKEMRFAV